jgi:uncharacterized Zn-finger protein
LKSRMLPLFLVLVGAIANTNLIGAQNPVSSSLPTDSSQRKPMGNPVNLQVLPKDMPREQVMQVMHRWESQLGVNCAYCHARDEAASAQAGRVRLKFEDDAKEEKKTTRLMYTMTQELNKKYISQLHDTSDPVSCSTCHRGHAHPETFVPVPEHHEGASPSASQSQ